MIISLHLSVYINYISYIYTQLNMIPHKMNRALCIKSIQGLNPNTWYNYHIITYQTTLICPVYIYIRVINHLHSLSERMEVAIMLKKEEFDEHFTELHEVRDDIINDLFT